MQTPTFPNPVRLVLGLALGICTTVLAPAGEPGRAALLEAIHCLENPWNTTRPGPRGELGAYQFRESTWRAYTTAPFSRALDRRTSDEVAVRHYDDLCARLQRAHLPASAYNIALAWNGGVTAAIHGRAPARSHDYAQRAVNLALVYDRGEAIADAR